MEAHLGAPRGEVRGHHGEAAAARAAAAAAVGRGAQAQLLRALGGNV